MFLYKTISTSFSSLPCRACRICLAAFSLVSVPYKNSHVQAFWIISAREYPIKSQNASLQ